MSAARSSRGRARLRLLRKAQHTEGADITAEIDSVDEGLAETSPPGPGRPDVESDAMLDDEIDAVALPDNARQRHGDRLAFVAGLMILALLTGLAGWTGYRAYVSQRTQQERNLFLHTARQAALNLTTVDYTKADADVQRILDSATGEFYDVFQKQSQPFIDVVTKAQSKSEGTVVEAALESEHRDQAQVLVAVDVTTTTSAPAAQDPRAWRMRITVHKVGEAAKVSNVEFVP